jgi:hypothetical protein
MRERNFQELGKMKKVWIFFSVFLFALSSLCAQTTVTISSTVAQAGLPRFGVNMGDDANYGQAQLLKDLNYSNNAYMSSFYWQASFACNGGGTNSTTQWFNGAYTSSGYYPANFWVGATYIAVNATTGASYGNGIITASTANSSSGIQFTLGTALSSACNTSAQDMLIVKLTNPSPTLTTPQQSGSGGTNICSGATWNTTDTDPSSTNTIQSLEMPTGCTVTYAIDPGMRNATNTNSTLASGAPSWINLNGSYSAVFMAKCPSSSGTSTLSVSAARLGGTTYISSTAEKLTCNSTTGAGWTTFTIPFTASETGTQNQNLQYTFICTGTCLLQEAHLYESSTLSGNTTPFRDSVVRKLQAINPGSLRFMDSSDWCSDVADMTGPAGNARTCNASSYVPFGGFSVPMGYATRLQLCAFIGADCWITVGNMTVASDWTNLINWLANTSDGPSPGVSWIQEFSKIGHKIYLEDGNETWNTSVPGGLWAGGGATYGYFLGPNIAAARVASGYNSSVIKLVSDNQDGGYGTYSWLQVSLSTAGCSLSTPSHCPDFQDSASYTLGYLASFAASGNNVSTTGAPFLDEWAEITNLTQSNAPSSSPATSSFHASAAYGKTKFGINMAIYEANLSPSQGSASLSQLQMNQISAGVGAGLITVQNFLLMQRDGGLTGPINLFTLPQDNFQYNNTSPYPAIWGVERYMACGPGQLSSCADVDRPQSIALQVVNNAIGSNNNLMSTQQSGTPTFSYAGGQVYPGWGNTIAANSSVPYVNCFSYANNTETNWTTICFNNNLSSSETVTLAGAGIPNGSVMQTTFPGSTNLITDNNEDTYLGSGSIAPVVTLPTPTTTSGTTYTIPPASFIALTYSTSTTGLPSPPTSVSGTVTSPGGN